VNDEAAKRARKLLGEVLRTYAKVADDTSAPRAARKTAASKLATSLVELKAKKMIPIHQEIS
jgi:hypothetical protein